MGLHSVALTSVTEHAIPQPGALPRPTDRPVYLDWAATCPMRPEAIEAMLPYLSATFGNPSGTHSIARQAAKAIDEAREVVAECLGAKPGEVVFTSGGTEADNLAISGVLAATGGRAVCSAVEHHAVLDVVAHHGGVVVGVDRHGVVDLDALEAALAPDVRVVSVMTANNEVGTVQPLMRITRMVSKRAPQAVVHTDAVQATSWIDVAQVAKHAQLISISAHKFGGPKGVGALVARAGTPLHPLLRGGGQERERRSGTQNVAGIVAMAEALRITVASRDETCARVAALRDNLVDRLRATVPGIHETVPRELRIAGNAHIMIDDVENEALLYLLDRAGVCASAASACASGAMEPSHVLAAMGVDRSCANGAVRFSLGYGTTADDIDRAVVAITSAVGRLRKVAS